MKPRESPWRNHESSSRARRRASNRSRRCGGRRRARERKHSGAVRKRSDANGAAGVAAAPIVHGVRCSWNICIKLEFFHHHLLRAPLLENIEKTLYSSSNYDRNDMNQNISKPQQFLKSQKGLLVLNHARIFALFDYNLINEEESTIQI